MQDDPIQAALDAAMLAYCNGMSGGACICAAGRRSRHCRVEPAVITAIAAFLRALPDQYSRGGAGFWDAIPAEDETRLWLAAAVERAAREAGDA